MSAAPVSMRRFGVFWFGEFISLTGSAISGFALLIFLYLRVESGLILGIAYALPILPFMAFSPFAGPLVDRWGAQPCLVASNLADLTNVASIGVLLYTHSFHVWNVYLYVCLASFIKALQLNAFEAGVPRLVPKSQLGRANGLRMLATGISAIIGPVISGALLVTIHMSGIIVLDCVSFVFALVSLMFVRIPSDRGQPATGSGEAANEPRRSLLGDFREASRYVAARPGLVALMILLGITSFGVGFAELLFRLIILAFSSAWAVGVVMSVGAIGMVAASLVLSVTGWPRRQVPAALGASGFFAASMVVACLRPSVPLIAACAFVFLASTTVIIRTVQTAWQLKVEPHMLGRAAALKNAFIVIPQAIADILAGWLADVMTPLVGKEHVHSRFVATLVGGGPGRGCALVLMAAGVLVGIFVLLVSLNPRLRHLEDELPDALPDPAQQPDADTLIAQELS